MISRALLHLTSSTSYTPSPNKTDASPQPMSVLATHPETVCLQLDASPHLRCRIESLSTTQSSTSFTSDTPTALQRAPHPLPSQRTERLSDNFFSSRVQLSQVEAIQEQDRQRVLICASFKHCYHRRGELLPFSSTSRLKTNNLTRISHSQMPETSSLANWDALAGKTTTNEPTRPTPMQLVVEPSTAVASTSIQEEQQGGEQYTEEEWQEWYRFQQGAEPERAAYAEVG